MRVACIGGGPGGLFFASLAKRTMPDAEVVVFERNRPEDTFGFGVVFSDATMGAIDDADPVLSTALAEHGTHWDHIEVRVHGAREQVAGMGMSAIVRTRLLRLLAERARCAGVDLRFSHEVRDPAVLDAFDLVVICDGANSRFRDRHDAELGTSVQTADAKFIWFGTTYPFDGLTFVHRRSQHGAFAAHAYPIAESLSTFIVEADAETWRAAGLDEFDPSTPPGHSDAKSLAYLEELFAPEIDGHPLIANNSRWSSFRTIRNQSWWRGNWVLLGDAAHTAHFSVGSGTKMAMEDAPALAEALAESADVPLALARYEQLRQPVVRKIQDAARPSLSWWEHFGTYTWAFEPVQFGFHFLTRSITRQQLCTRDPGYVDRVDKWWHEQHGAHPLMTPWRSGTWSLPARRVSVAQDGALTAGTATVPMSTMDAWVAGTGAWLNAPPMEAGLPVARAMVDRAAERQTPVLGIRRGTPLTRQLVAEYARLTRGVPVAVTGAADEDTAVTLLLSGRADLVVMPDKFEEG